MGLGGGIIKQKLFLSAIFIFGILLVINVQTGYAASVTTTVLNHNPASNVVNSNGDKTLVSTSATSNNIVSAESDSQADIDVSTAASTTYPNYKKYVVLVVRAKNNGPDTATNVKINFWFNHTYIKYIRDDGNGYYNHKTGKWFIQTLNSGDGSTLHIVGQIIRPNTKLNLKAFFLSSTSQDNNPLNNEDVVTINVPKAADISVTQSASNYNPVYLHHVFFTIVVKNNGPNTAENLTAYCNLDPNILKYIADDSHGAYDFHMGIWDIGILKSGSQITLHVRAKVKVFNTSIRNLVGIQSDTYDTTAGNNRAGVRLTVPKLTLASLASSLSIGTGSTYDKAVNIFYWVRDYVEYSFYYNTRYGAAGTLDRLEGNCVDLSHLLVALARSAGVPARYKYGNCFFYLSQHWYGHVWVNFYVNGPQGLKWYPVDASNNDNDFGVIRNWNTSNFQLKGVYNKLPF